MLKPQFKPKECSAPGCGKSFLPLRFDQKVCSVRCALKVARAQTAKGRQELRERKAALKRIPDLIKEADRVFAAYIRARDRLAGFPCISSGRPLDWSGNQVDAGHYRSRGAASHIRYHEDNCHAQTKFDNQHRAGNIVAYRKGLIERIGLERVEALEANNEPVKWTREVLLGVIATYKAKRKALEDSTE